MSIVLEKAAELAAAIEECEELKTVKEKQAAVADDKDAEAILSSFFAMQQQIAEVQAAGKEPGDELMAQFNEVQNKMESNLAVAEYYQSQAVLGQLLQQVNSLITKAITGEECSEEDCAHCSGC